MDFNEIRLRWGRLIISGGVGYTVSYVVYLLVGSAFLLLYSEPIQQIANPKNNITLLIISYMSWAVGFVTFVVIYYNWTKDIT